MGRTGEMRKGQRGKDYTTRGKKRSEKAYSLYIRYNAVQDQVWALF